MIQTGSESPVSSQRWSRHATAAASRGADGGGGLHAGGGGHSVARRERRATSPPRREVPPLVRHPLFGRPAAALSWPCEMRAPAVLRSHRN
jgi:hypothetical protein